VTPTLEVAASEEPDATVLVLDGDLDRTSAWMLTAAVIRCDATTASRVVVDLQHVPFIDGGGLRALADAARRARRRGCDFAVANPSEQVARLLRMTGLDNSLEVVTGDRRPH
jgi:anti-sigma B factor antagonist